MLHNASYSWNTTLVRYCLVSSILFLWEIWFNLGGLPSEVEQGSCSTEVPGSPRQPASMWNFPSAVAISLPYLVWESSCLTLLGFCSLTEYASNVGQVIIAYMRCPLWGTFSHGYHMSRFRCTLKEPSGEQNYLHSYRVALLVAIVVSWR